ncbi:MAG: hypothetical protein KC457_29675, partial [Myxococcales bacterium]|nr:hypothetical protein [Myxococcales bacterium]
MDRRCLVSSPLFALSLLVSSPGCGDDGGRNSEAGDGLDGIGSFGDEASSTGTGTGTSTSTSDD